jgi:hypothetical protein
MPWQLVDGSRLPTGREVREARVSVRVADVGLASSGEDSSARAPFAKAGQLLRIDAPSIR